MSSLAHLMGWFLLHALWQGAAIGALAWILLALLPRPWTRLRHDLGCLLLVAMVAVPAATALRMRPAAAPQVGTAKLEAEGQVTGVPTGYQLPAPGWRARTRQAAMAVIPWLPLLWLPGVAFMGWRMAGGGLWLRRARRRALPVKGPWAIRVLELAREMGLRRMVDLASLPDLDGPVVTGLLRPVVLVPLSLLSTLPPDQVDMLLRHELAHVRRGDVLLNLLQRGLEALLFFQPAVVWLGARVREERELCADAVASQGGRQVDLAEALTGLLSLRLGFDLPDPTFAVGALDGALGDRLKALLDLPRPQRQLRLAMVAVPLVALTVVGAWAVRKRVRIRRMLQTQAAQAASAKPAVPQEWKGISVVWQDGQRIWFHAPWATPDEMVAAFDMGLALHDKDGRNHWQTLEPSADPKARRYNLSLTGTRQVILETLWRLKSLPPIPMPQGGLVVRRDNLLLPGDDPLDPPLDLWVPKSVDQFYPEMARLVREAMLELKALPVTPGVAQEVRREVPDAILSAMKAPSPGEPQYRLTLKGQAGYLAALEGQPLAPEKGLIYQLAGVELSPVPGFTQARWDALGGQGKEAPEPPQRPRVSKKATEQEKVKARLGYEKAWAAYEKAREAREHLVNQGEEARRKLVEGARAWAKQRLEARLKSLKLPEGGQARTEPRGWPEEGARLRLDEQGARIWIPYLLDPGFLKGNPVAEARLLKICLRALEELDGPNVRRKVRRRS